MKSGLTVIARLLPKSLAWMMCCLLLTPTVSSAQQIIVQDDGPFSNPPVAVPASTTPPQDSQPVEVENTLRNAPVDDSDSIGDQFIRLHMWDGSIVTGDFMIEQITVSTEFGNLQVPVNQIKRFHPGLDSFPELNAKINSLVEGLGDKDFDIREKSQRALAAMGMQLRDRLGQFEDKGSAERKKRLAELRNEIDEMLDDALDEGDETDIALIDGDTIETPGFTIVGKIQEDRFRLKTKFGPLSVPISDIKMADRVFKKARDEIRKTVEVGGEAFFQRQTVSTKIRVNKGDRILIKGEGIVQWTNWSTASGPDGLPNQGQYMGIPSGALCLRIGNSGQPQKVGSRIEIVAKKTGMLYLGVAMQDNYVNQQGYRWTGNFKAKIQIKPVPTE